MTCFKCALHRLLWGSSVAVPNNNSLCLPAKGAVFCWPQPCNVPWGSEDKDGNLSLCTHLRTM